MNISSYFIEDSAFAAIKNIDVTFACNSQTFFKLSILNFKRLVIIILGFYLSKAPEVLLKRKRADGAD